MKKVTLLLAAILSAFAFLAVPDQAQAEPTITSGIVEDPSNSYLRGFSEIGFGALFGTIAGGVPFITTLFAKHDVPLALGLGAALYPAGVASGMIMGGYLTDSYSNYWAPFVGAYAGALVADVTAYFLADEYPTFSAIFVLVFPIITATIATEVSHTNNKREAYYPILLTFPF